MLEGLAQVPGGSAVLPFVRVFYCSPSVFLWGNDDGGTVHTIHQGEKGEQGDALVPLLFCPGRHAALEAIQRELTPDKKLFAFLGDLYLVSKANTVGALHNLAQRELWANCRIHIHGGKTHVWNPGGTKPEACEVRQKLAESVNQDLKCLCTTVDVPLNACELLTTATTTLFLSLGGSGFGKPFGCLLGELARHAAHDPDKAPRSCRFVGPPHGRGISKFASGQGSRDPIGRDSRFRSAPMARSRSRIAATGQRASGA